MDRLHSLSDIIYYRSGVNFFEKDNNSEPIMTYESSIKPFYSGLAAYLYLHYRNMRGFSVPFNGTIEEQAQFWLDNYTTKKGATVFYFINAVVGMLHLIR